MPHSEQQVICAQGYSFRVKRLGSFHAHVYRKPLPEPPDERNQETFAGFFLLIREPSDQRFRCADCVDPNGCRMEYVDEVLASV